MKKRRARRAPLHEALAKLDTLGARVAPARRAAFISALRHAVRLYYTLSPPSEWARLIRDYHRRGHGYARVVRGEEIAKSGGRNRRKLLLILQASRGHPGREAERVLVAFLATAWTMAGGVVARGWNDQPSEFEHLVGDVLANLLIDDQISAQNLVRLHCETRPKRLPHSALIKLR
jgi:hypothetical protein